MGFSVDETWLKKASELEDMRIETSKPEKERKTEKKKSKQNRTEYPGTVDNYKSYNIYVMVIPEEEERKKEKQCCKQ